MNSVGFGGHTEELCHGEGRNCMTFLCHLDHVVLDFINQAILEEAFHDEGVSPGTQPEVLLLHSLVEFLDLLWIASRGVSGNGSLIEKEAVRDAEIFVEAAPEIFQDLHIARSCDCIEDGCCSPLVCHDTLVLFEVLHNLWHESFCLGIQKGLDHRFQEVLGSRRLGLRSSPFLDQFRGIAAVGCIFHAHSVLGVVLWLDLLNARRRSELLCTLCGLLGSLETEKYKSKGETKHGCELNPKGSCTAKKSVDGFEHFKYRRHRTG
mmetsp:Transcript_74188/g.131178  ORF Transcript_74188/g.131178 Transcript_74188/m.131178 type:complete len:264 (+) Transcript_74188:2416-3207(+)